MMSNHTRFNQFIDSIQRMNPRTLSTRLKEMEKDPFVRISYYFW
jgi:DNA-binding HxlR family transcriptional regulator